MELSPPFGSTVHVIQWALKITKELKLDLFQQIYWSRWNQIQLSVFWSCRCCTPIKTNLEGFSERDITSLNYITLCLVRKNLLRDSLLSYVIPLAIQANYFFSFCKLILFLPDSLEKNQPNKKTQTQQWTKQNQSNKIHTHTHTHNNKKTPRKFHRYWQRKTRLIFLPGFICHYVSCHEEGSEEDDKRDWEKKRR